MNKPQWQAVVSSNIESIAYEYEEENLLIKFHSGRIYRYLEVDPEIFQQMQQAPSIGKYFAANIKPAYKYEVME